MSHARGPTTIVLSGIVAEHADHGMVKFAHDLDLKKWIEIPKTSVESLVKTGKNAEGHERASLTLKTENAGQVLASVLAVSFEAVMSLGRKVLAVTSTGPTPDASQACLNCIKSCKLQLADDSDPFKQITCILSCKSCP
jgi:hypothetical protein